MNFKSFFAAALVLFVMTSNAFAAGSPSDNLKVSQKAQAAIVANFPGASDLKWGNGKEEGYIAYFMEPGARKVAQVDKDGHIESVLTYYSEGYAPSDLAVLLAKEFPSRTLRGIIGIEIKEGENAGTYYQANLEDAKHWYFVVINGDDIRVSQVLDKQ